MTTAEEYRIEILEQDNARLRSELLAAIETLKDEAVAKAIVEEERIQAEKVANALATDLDNWKRDFSFQHQRADKAETELTRVVEAWQRSRAENERLRDIVERLRDDRPIRKDEVAAALSTPDPEEEKN